MTTSVTCLKLQAKGAWVLCRWEKNEVAMGKMSSCHLGNWQNLFHHKIKGIKVLIHLKDTAEKHPLYPVCAGPSR